MNMQDLAKKIETYWDKRSTAFSAVRRRELSGPNAALWLKLIAAHLPQGENVRILDVGTGAGFFPVILSMSGYDVTGVDCSTGMIEEAKKNLAFFGCQANILTMDAQKLDFPDASFDAVISRNLTWTLPDVMEAYREWSRVLKTDGTLINFDSDCGKVTFSKQDDQTNVHAGIDDELITECNEIKEGLRISTHRRPDWDAEYLSRLGFSVTVENNVAPLVRQDANLHYDNTPLFAIYAKRESVTVR